MRLIVGLGNPGAEYENTRHNAGFWLVDEIARRFGGQFSSDTKFQGQIARVTIGGEDVRLLKPQTFMNLSGASVSAMAKYFKFSVDDLVVAHDELDLPPGSSKFKKGGGHAGHNGLRDIAKAMDSKEFVRLRIGIGHPGNAKQVSNYVLARASQADQQLIQQSIDDCASAVEILVKQGYDPAVHYLHNRKAG